MKLCVHTIVATILLLSPVFLVSAQTSCGSITAPHGWQDYVDSSALIETEPIVDCDSPFGLVIDAASPRTLQIQGSPVVQGSVITIDTDTVDEYEVSNVSVPNTSYDVILFRHEGLDYQYVNIEPLEMTEADCRELATTFFTNQADVDTYVTRIMSPHPWDGIERGSLEYQLLLGFFNYIDAHFVPLLTPLTPGTYTFVTKKHEYFQQGLYHTSLRYLAQLLLPVAEAATPDTYVVTFTIKKAAPVPIGASSVLFLPGIMSSRLYTDGVLGTENKLWETNGNVDVPKLAMSGSGSSVNAVYTRDIPASVYLGYVSIYGGFVQYMDTLVDQEVIHQWKPFAYDWRYSVDDIANNGTQYQNEVKNIVDEIELLASSSYSKKVTIIGHSNGGLLAKAAMIRLAALGKTNLVDTVVLLASPQLGTPKAIGSILHGYDQELGYGFIVDDVVAREAMRNMPGAYGLIPSQEYFTVTTTTLIRFDNSTSTQLFRNAYGSTIDSLAELSGFMSGEGDSRAEATNLDEALRANSALVQKELQLHTALDTWAAPAGVRVVEIVGTGLDTVSGFEYRGFTERVCTILGVFSCSIKNMYKPVPIISQSGDQTVIQQSATGYEGEKEKYFIDLKNIFDTRKEDAVKHFNITENPSIQQLLKNIITSTTSDVDFITQSPYIAATNRLMFGSHSPVTLEVVDAQGRRAGRGVKNGIPIPIEDIPGSSYFELGSSTYVIVPDGMRYDIVIKGTSQGGLTFSLDTLNGEVQAPLVSVQVATITPSTTVSVSYTNNVLGNVSIDQNGDGVTDQVLTPQGIDVTPKVTYVMLKAAIQKLRLTSLRKAALLLLATTAETLDKNPKLVALETLALNQLEALLVSYQKNNWITQNELLVLKGIINKLK